MLPKIRLHSEAGRGQVKSELNVSEYWDRRYLRLNKSEGSIHTSFIVLPYILYLKTMCISQTVKKKIAVAPWGFLR